MRAVAVLLALTVPALAAPPPGVNLDGELHAWFERQYSLAGQSCCGLGDGHILADDEWRIRAEGYEVRIFGTWIKIAKSKLRDEKGGPNPTGHAVVWYSSSVDGAFVYCFAPGQLY